MAKRKSRSVSLGRGGDALPPGHADASPERLRHARATGTATIDPPGIRRIGEPFDLLRSRGLLDRDPAFNDILWQAGNRLRTHRHLASLDGLRGLDLTRPHVDGGSGSGGPASPGEAALRHREAYRRATAAVGARLMPYVTAVVIEGQTVASLRALVGDTGHARTAEALALERLRESLHRLCDFWGMRVKTRMLPVAGWRDETASA